MLACTFDAWSDKSEDRIYLAILIFLAWFLPLTVISICYYKVNMTSTCITNYDGAVSTPSGCGLSHVDAGYYSEQICVPGPF